MKVTLVRNATILLEYGGKNFLIDPVLGKKEAYPGLLGTARSELRNPRVDLPMDVEDILAVDVVIVTHTHPDHWDQAAMELLPKDILIFSQNEKDQEAILSTGFSNVSILQKKIVIGDISLEKTGGQHGSPSVYKEESLAKRLGSVSGVVLRHPMEKTLYLAGDTVWNATVADVIKESFPEIIILNAGEATIPDHGAIIMGAEDVLQVHKAKPDATLIAVHMEVINHCLLTRQELRFFAKKNNFSEKLFIPNDGETYSL